MNQQRRLDLIATDISGLQKTQAITAARLNQLKRANLELSHRVLQVHGRGGTGQAVCSVADGRGWGVFVAFGICHYLYNIAYVIIIRA